MIESINIKNIATFNAEGVEINDLKKVNFIYGANGSGKTTISNYLQCPDDEKYQGENCYVKWKNNVNLNVLTYNKDFRERNFGKGKIAGIFTIGQATKKQKEEIDNKTEQLNKLKEDGMKKKETLSKQIQDKQTLEDTFQEDCWTKIYKKYENVFKEAFRGYLKKESFKTQLLQEYATHTNEITSYEELTEKAKTLFGEQPPQIDPINNITFDRILEIENNDVWNKIIVGKADVDIAKLINKLNINDWVNQGRNYLQKNNSVCPFCQQQTITDDFRKQIEQFFDETYLNELKTLKDLKLEYDILTHNIINELNTIEENQRNFRKTKLNIDKFSSYLKTLISQITVNKEYLSNKEKEPSRQFTLISLKEQFELIFDLIKMANNEIQKHNNIVANFNAEKTNLIKSVWKFIAEEFKTAIAEFNKKKNGLETGIIKLNGELETKRKEYNDLNAEIKTLNKNVTSIQPTIDEINRLLKSFGFLNFEIVSAQENGFYKIQREDGTVAESTLSEGEITFITFLYFLQLTKGGISEDKVHEERVLVIDDPISSLDSNVLFVVSSLIKEIIKDIKANKGQIKQLILLTHNIYFYKEVSFEGLNRSKGEKSQFWILRKNLKSSIIQTYGDNNPIQSSYELLWREIKEWKNNSGITIQNTMRRILEHFFGILGNKRDDFLMNKFDNSEEKEICRSLLYWINEGSHTLNDDLYIETPDDTIEKYLNVFQKIFEYTENIGHYNMMMEIDE